MLNGKGGIGKTFVASQIAQYLKESGTPLVCLDTDVVNHSFRDFTALAVETVDVFHADSDEIDSRAMDSMTERFLKEDTNFVVDTGATSFLPLSRYLIEAGIPELIVGAGKTLVIHAVIAGGQELIQTVNGFEAILRHFPASAEIIVWLNAHHGEIDQADASFEETPIYEQHKGRIAAIVRLPRQHRAFGQNLATMLKQHLTFAEADQADGFYVVEKQRLRQIKRGIWEQLVQAL